MAFYIYHHLGLGDHIICNGLVRELINNSEYEKFCLFAKIQNHESVRFMFRDIKKLEIICVKNDMAVKKIIRKIDKNNYIKIGHENLDNNNKYFDQDFYRIAKINFSKRWSSFKVIRDKNREDALFNRLELESFKYVFVHDDHFRNFRINEKFINNKNLRIVRPFITPIIFDWCKVLEEASELHCVDSSFRLIADSLELKTKNLFFHYSYISKDTKFISSSKYNWIIL